MELAIFCVIVYLVSWLGGSAAMGWRWTHTGLHLVLSFVGGLMLGVGLLHLLPHGVAVSGSLEMAMPAALAGLLTMFFLIRIFHVHLHGPEEESSAACHHGVPHAHGVRYIIEAGQSIGTFTTVRAQVGTGSAVAEHHSVPAHGGSATKRESHPGTPARFGWLGLAAGLSLHMILDGVALAASVSATRSNATTSLAWGPFLAILLHEPLDIMSITTVMRASGWSRRSVLGWNALFAAMCPLGAILCAIGIWSLIENQAWFLGALLAFSGGMFLCISLSDLLPELQFHAHDRWPLSVALLSGVCLAYAITWVEPSHLHHWPDDHQATHSQAVGGQGHHAPGYVDHPAAEDDKHGDREGGKSGATPENLQQHRVR